MTDNESKLDYDKIGEILGGSSRTIRHPTFGGVGAGQLIGESQRTPSPTEKAMSDQLTYNPANCYISDAGRVVAVLTTPADGDKYGPAMAASPRMVELLKHFSQDEDFNSRNPRSVVARIDTLLAEIEAKP